MKQKHGRKFKLAALLAACALTVSAMIAGGTLFVGADTEDVGGKFLISGGTAANGDYSYDEDNSLLTILTSTPITIRSVNNQFVNAKSLLKTALTRILRLTLCASDRPTAPLYPWVTALRA